MRAAQTLSQSADWESPVLRTQQTISSTCLIHCTTACQNLEPIAVVMTGFPVVVGWHWDWMSWGGRRRWGFTLTQTAVDNKEGCPPFPCCRGQGGWEREAATPVDCPFVKRFVGRSVEAVRREEGRANRGAHMCVYVWVCVCGGGCWLTSWCYQRTTHNEIPVDFASQTHLGCHKKKLPLKFPQPNIFF